MSGTRFVPTQADRRMNKWIFLISGGVCGTVGRYLLSGAAHRCFGEGFPYGTLTVNLIGAFAVGFLGTLTERQLHLGPEFRLFWIVGLLGAFTTFSALVYESWSLIRADRVFLAGLNIAGSMMLGLAAFLAGHLLAGRG